MSKLDFIDDLGATLFCSGQDWKPGDGSASNVDVHCDKAKQQIKDLMLELIGEDKKPYDDLLDDGTVVDSEEYNTIARYLRQKVEEL